MAFTYIDADNTSQTYTKFSRLTASSKPRSSQVVVIAWIEGEPELWLLESETGVTDLLSFYHDFWQNDSVRLTLTRVE